jgi:hypothetical protein
VLAQLEHLDGLSRAVPWSTDFRGEVRRRLAEWLALIDRQPIAARQVLRKVLPDRLVMTPKVTTEGRWYEYAGLASYGGLQAGVLRVQGLVPRGASLARPGRAGLALLPSSAYRCCRAG